MSPEKNAVHPLTEKARSARVPIAELLWFRVEEVAGGRAVGSMRAGPQHANPMGTLHGGVLCDLADAAMGMAFASTTLAPDESFTTIALSISFAHLDLDASLSVGMHFGTFQLTTEGIDEPLRALEDACRASRIPSSRFRTLGFGEPLRLE